MGSNTVYRYGVMSSKFELEAKNKLTAYSAMFVHYAKNAHLITIYEPESSREDCWFDATGQILERLDEIFGGKDSFGKYIKEKREEIETCIKTIKQI